VLAVFGSPVDIVDVVLSRVDEDVDDSYVAATGSSVANVVGGLTGMLSSAGVGSIGCRLGKSSNLVNAGIGHGSSVSALSHAVSMSPCRDLQ
jgi:hypothetical protein